MEGQFMKQINDPIESEYKQFELYQKIIKQKQ